MSLNFVKWVGSDLNSNCDVVDELRNIAGRMQETSNDQNTR